MGPLLRLSPTHGDAAQRSGAKFAVLARFAVVIAVCTFVQVLVMMPGTAFAQSSGCPRLHQCLVGCSDNVLRGGGPRDFAVCSKGCQQRASCAAGTFYQTPAMNTARACSALHLCLVQCSYPMLEGGDSNTFRECYGQCFADGSQCVGRGNVGTHVRPQTPTQPQDTYTGSDEEFRGIVKTIQRQLNDARCNAGPVDGSWGAQSERAMDRWIARAGLPYPDEMISRQTIILLAKNRGVKCRRATQRRTPQRQQRWVEPGEDLQPGDCFFTDDGEEVCS